MRTAWTFLAILALGHAPLAAGETSTIPDLLLGQGPTPDQARGADWFLHFYGTRGWIHGHTGAEGNRARQLLITHVPPFSQVREQLAVGDVLLGVDGVPFDRHPVYQFREFSHPAQRADEGLTVTMWRRGWDAPRTVEIVPTDPRPDFTRGDTVDLTAEGMSVDRNLGATGARGWMYDRMERANQILVTHVHAGSPAEGVLRAGDVILGIGDEPFVGDARRTFGRALTQAETAGGGGRLHLLRWRDGVTEPVAIQLEVLGSYGDTSPWDCEKSAKILENATAYLERIGTPVGSELGIQALVGSLGLLATGDERLMPRVREHVEALVRRTAGSGEQPPYESYPAWSWGYANLLLTEYFLLTGDRQVLPAIRAFSTAIARGQAMTGTWGHGMAPRDPISGELHGPLGGYGTMNQISTICWISLVLAQRCGVTDPVIEHAIRGKHDFLRDFIDVGTVTYGDNLPGGLLHDDNGKNSAAAVGFALMGDLPGTAFFSRMTVASHAIREDGHTGNYWSDLWGGLGAARAGRQACGAFLLEDAWRFDLERRWDGGFEYQAKAGMGNGVDPDTGRQRVMSEHTTPHWDTTGARLVLYSLPRAKLAITGRDAVTVALTPDEVASVIEAGRPPADAHWPRKYNPLPTPRLLELLASWSPVVREQAARSLAEREDPPVEALRAMLGSVDRYARYGACDALRHLGTGSRAAVGDLIALLGSEDRVLQVGAIQALGATEDMRAVEALLDLAGRETPNDRYDVVRRRIADALFGRTGSLFEQTRRYDDRERLLGATRRFLTSITGHSRTVVAENVLPSLTFEEFRNLWPQIDQATRTSATTYNTAIHMATLRRLQQERVREGIDRAVAYLTGMRGHGSQNRVPEVLEILRGYGAHARVALPGLERAANYFENEEQDFPRHLSIQKAGHVRDMIRELEALEDPGDGDGRLIAIADGWR